MILLLAIPVLLALVWRARREWRQECNEISWFRRKHSVVLEMAVERLAPATATADKRASTTVCGFESCGKAFSNASHIFSASTGWAQRGRSGPIGVAFDAQRRHPVFASNVPRKQFTAKPPPGRKGVSLTDDCFVLKSDHRKLGNLQGDFTSKLQHRIEYGLAPRAPVISAPNI